MKVQNALFFKELSQAVEDELPLAKSFCFFLPVLLFLTFYNSF